MEIVSHRCNTPDQKKVFMVLLYQGNGTREKGRVGMLAVEAPRFRKGSGAKEDSSPASSLSTL
jgi:hypothetical protein